MKIKERDIEKLKNELEEYNQIKLKFLRNFGEYTEKEINTFWKNFYKKKLDIMLSTVLYYYKKNELKSSTNPFIAIDDKQEANNYNEKILEMLNTIDKDIVSSDIILLEQYAEIQSMIEKMQDKYIFSQKFWYTFMEFYMRYKEINKKKKE